LVPPPAQGSSDPNRRTAPGRSTSAPRTALRRALALALIAAVAAAVGLIVSDTSGRAHRQDGRHAAASPGPSGRAPARLHSSTLAVGLRVLKLVDASRTLTPPGGASTPRTLLTYVRYPALASRAGNDLPDAPPASGGGPYPLIVFGHGFAVTPAPYRRLLQSWARAGYVVAAPVFPLENANAPGGPDESDLVNQPADMSFVITRLLAGGGPLAGVIDPRLIAVAGQSDGGETALAVAYDRRFLDPRVRAAVILSGAEIPGVSGFTFPPGSPPLLATQGTADTVNPPSFTATFFERARRPKYLLRLFGASHLPPYTDQQPQLGIVERVTLAFLDGYLKHTAGSLQRLPALAAAGGVASLTAEP
jgi:dienelactone hydrolase